ncbi:uncharacterized protein BO87DRAFT_301655 [Aspergillus neoniger CBS 115656]|uniref:Uncharacterized protein n=1 Tax=Aspergillus neoniger (strain CBS 115656) TaxID=1448310 RepID=A0A318YSA9_ASPNB|nr:hypothetical protein BO87DRAFT_301655 [Aspergillus neoniger CBS 115656]PYH37531.1 hypothetical protein BO87DRAFT_301655 [Aspergillus neoniger CBS 115656]
MLSSAGQSKLMRRGLRSRYSHGIEKSQYFVSGQLQPKRNSQPSGVNRKSWQVGQGRFTGTIEPNPGYGSTIATGKAGLETSEVRQLAREGRGVANRIASTEIEQLSVFAMADVQSRHPIILAEEGRQMKINPAPERGQMRDYSSADVGDQLKRISP